MPLTDGGAKRRITTAKDPGVATAEASKPGIALTCSGTPAGKCRSRYPLVTGLPRAQEYPAHGAVHRVGADALQGLLALTIYATSQKMPDFRQQMSRIIAWLAFDSGKVRGASNIGWLSDTASVSGESGRGIRRGILDVACIVRHFRSCLQYNRSGSRVK
jgi:hypothetical protein